MVNTTEKINKTDILGYLKEIKGELVEQGIKEIALFGSFARDRVDMYSDIDIAIQIQSDYLKTRSSWDYFDLIAKIKSLISQKFHITCDIFDLDSNSFMKESVMKDLIYV
jgi:predicted nucleotidyltransferase